MSESKITIEESIMAKIKSGKATMKPRWYFLVGSSLLVFGLASLVTLLLFLAHLMIFSLKTHGPRAEIRYDQLIQNFPWWALVLMVVGVGLGSLILKKYDFSYKKNLKVIVAMVVVSILLVGVLLTVTSLDEVLLKRGPMRGMYQRYDGSEVRRVPSRQFLQR